MKVNSIVKTVILVAIGSLFFADVVSAATPRGGTPPPPPPPAPPAPVISGL